MKTSLWLSWLLPAVLAVDLSDTCSDASGAFNGCSGTYDYPVSATKQCTSSGSCQIVIKKEKRTICSAIREGMPGDGEDSGNYFIANIDSFCSCLTAMKFYSESDAVTIYLDDGEVSSSINSIILDSILHIDQDPLFDVSDNRRYVVQDLDSQGYYTVAQGADVTVDLYQEFSHAIKGCWDANSGCDPDKILSFFYDYTNLSNDVMYGAIPKMLKRWVSLFDTILTKISSVKTAATNVQSHLKTATTKIDATKKKICANGACNGPTATAFLKQVSAVLSAVKALDGMVAQADKAKPAASQVQQTCINTLSQVASPWDKETLVGMVQYGSISHTGDFIRAFPIADNMPYIASDLQRQVIPVILATKYQNKGATAAKNISTVLATDWSKKSGSQTVRNGFTSIQSTIKTELRDYVNKLNTEMKGLDDSLNLFELRKNDLDWYVGSDRVSRWVVEEFYLPCMETKTKTYSKDGYSASASYPTFYKCFWGPEIIYMSNHHIPWIKWAFRSNQ